MDDYDGLEVFMSKGSSGGSGAHEGKGSSDGKGKGGYTGRHEAPVKPAPAKGGGTGQPAEWFDEQLIRRDIEKGHDMVGTIEDLSR